MNVVEDLRRPPARNPNRTYTEFPRVYFQKISPCEPKSVAKSCRDCLIHANSESCELDFKQVGITDSRQVLITKNTVILA